MMDDRTRPIREWLLASDLVAFVHFEIFHLFVRTGCHKRKERRMSFFSFARPSSHLHHQWSSGPLSSVGKVPFHSKTAELKYTDNQKSVTRQQ